MGCEGGKGGSVSTYPFIFVFVAFVICDIVSVARMSPSHLTCKDPWRPRQRLCEKPGPRWALIQIILLLQMLSLLQVISAEGEQNASRVLREAADIMDESPATLQLRYLQTLHAISAQNNHTYVFPLPVDLLVRLFGNKS